MRYTIQLHGVCDRSIICSFCLNKRKKNVEKISLSRSRRLHRVQQSQLFDGFYFRKQSHRRWLCHSTTSSKFSISFNFFNGIIIIRLKHPTQTIEYLLFHTKFVQFSINALFISNRF